MMTRREALSLLSAVPLVRRDGAQAVTPRGRRVFCQGNSHFVLEPDGTVRGWRLGLLGASGYAVGAGHNDPIAPYTAVSVAGLTNAVSLAIGNYASYAVLADGRLMAWGSNARGGLGNTPLTELEATAGPRPLANAPTPVLGLTDVIAVASGGGDHTLALTRGGRVYAWGIGGLGQLGIGPMPIINFKNHSAAAMAFVPFPVLIPGLTDVIGIAAGVQHSLALLKDGTVRAWGLNRNGQLGDGTTITRTIPVPVLGVRGAVSVHAHSNNSAALLPDGTVMTWGYGSDALARKPLKEEAPYPTPALAVGVKGVRELAVADVAMFGLTETGTIVSWGGNLVGERGHGGSDPAPIPGLTNVQSIAATVGRTFAVLANGTIMTIGAVPLWAHLRGGDPAVSRIPVPLVLKGLPNP